MNITGTRKPFCQESYDRNDLPTKIVIASHLIKSNQVVDISENYENDIISWSETGDIYRHEVERSQSWETGEFPWNLLHIPERKENQVISGVHFWKVSRDYRSAVRINTMLIVDFRKKEFPNRYVASGEMFFRVPVGLCQKVELL